MPTRRILLTGAYNLTGSHILDQLLSYDVSIRAVVGSREEAHALQRQYPRSASVLDIAIVPLRDAAIPGAFDEALREYPQPFDTVIHTVAADPSDEADCLARFVSLGTDTLTSFLRSVRAVAPRVRRVVITTSLTPFARWLVDPQVQRSPYGGNPASHRVAEIDSEDVLATSQASDNIVHSALLNWMRSAQAQFDLVYITAPSLYGPLTRPLETSSDLVEANRRVWNICSSDGRERISSPPYGIDCFADVRDFARAGVQGAFVPQAGNRRFIVSAGTMPPGAAIANYLIRHFPELGSRVRAAGSPPRRPPSGNPPLDSVATHMTATVLGLTTYRTVEQTLFDLAHQILELHRRKEWKRVIQS